MIWITQEKNGGRDLSLKRWEKYWCTLLKTSWNLCEINVFAKASNTLKMFSCMLCKGVCYVEALISIYRVSWAFVAVGEWSIVLCHVSWDLPTFTWNSGQNEILQNVVVFIMIFIWVHVDERSDMHLGFRRWMSHKFLGCTMKIIFVRLQNVVRSDLLWNLSWNMCRIS